MVAAAAITRAATTDRKVAAEIAIIIVANDVLPGTAEGSVDSSRIDRGGTVVRRPGVGRGGGTALTT